MAPSWGYPLPGVGIRFKKASLPADLMGNKQQEKAFEKTYGI